MQAENLTITQLAEDVDHVNLKEKQYGATCTCYSCKLREDTEIIYDSEDEIFPYEQPEDRLVKYVHDVDMDCVHKFPGKIKMACTHGIKTDNKCANCKHAKSCVTVKLKGKPDETQMLYACRHPKWGLRGRAYPHYFKPYCRCEDFEPKE